MSTLPTYADAKAEGQATAPPPLQPTPVAGTGYAPQAQPIYQTQVQHDGSVARSPPQSWKHSFWACCTPVDLCTFDPFGPFRAGPSGTTTAT